MNNLKEIEEGLQGEGKNKENTVIKLELLQVLGEVEGMITEESDMVEYYKRVMKIVGNIQPIKAGSPKINRSGLLSELKSKKKKSREKGEQSEDLRVDLEKVTAQRDALQLTLDEQRNVTEQLSKQYARLEEEMNTMLEKNKKLAKQVTELDKQLVEVKKNSVGILQEKQQLTVKINEQEEIHQRMRVEWEEMGKDEVNNKGYSSWITWLSISLAAVSILYNIMVE